MKLKLEKGHLNSSNSTPTKKKANYLSAKRIILELLKIFDTLTCYCRIENLVFQWNATKFLHRDALEFKVNSEHHYAVREKY